MCKKLGILFLLLTIIFVQVGSPALKGQAAEESLNTGKIDQYVTEYLEKNGLPGASIVVVKDGQSLYEKGYGHDSEGNPITERSLMRIASVSKSFTAFAVLQLIDEGKIQLDEPVVNYIPEVVLDDVRWKEVTIRQLLSHTSGIPNQTIVAPARTSKEGVERLHDWKLQSKPGEKHAYSNPNYWILAYLVEKVSGIEFPEYLEKNIFAPLGMNDSLTAVNSGDHVQGLPKGYVTAYGGAIPWTELEQMFLGAGGVITTASDMAKWLSMHLNGGKNETGDQLLSEELLKESYSQQPGSEKYGLGWSLSTNSVPERISHSGSLSTYQTQQTMMPSEGFAVAVMLNSFTTTFEHAYAISSGIIEITDGTEPEVGAPKPKIIDLVLGFITFFYFALGIRGMIRSRKWAEKRKHQPLWRYYLRLVPQLIAVVGTGWVFFILPTLKNNSSTMLNVFGLWPAAAIFMAVIFIVGFFLIILRIFARANNK